MLSNGRSPSPNNLLRQARLRTPSPSGSGRPMSRQELADAVNTYVAHHDSTEATLDANQIGKMERGHRRWPGKLRRDGFRHALGVGSDQELGFYIIRSSEPPGSAAESPSPSPSPDEESSQGTRLLLRSTWDPVATEELDAFLADKRGLGPETAQLLAGLWRVTDPPQVLETRAGRHVGARLATLVLERTDTLRRMDDFLGGGDLHDLVRRELRSTIALVRGASYTEAIGHQLLAAVGELCQLAGWVASDAGLYVPAERYYLGGVSAAHAARDEPLAANLLSSLSYQMATIGDRREAVLLATGAAHGAGAFASATTRALLGERVAWAYARMGNRQDTLRTLGEVDEFYANANPSVDPIWVYWLDRGEIDVMAGRCLTELHCPGRAVPLLSQAIEQYDQAHARELALYLSWLAEAHIQLGNIDEGAAVATQALGLSSTVTSVRGVDRIRLIRRLLVPYHGTPVADDFEDQAAAISS